MRLIILYIVTVFTFIVGCNSGNNSFRKMPVEDFFVRSERSNFRVSPDGRRIAYLGLESHCRNIFILDLDRPDSSKQLTYQKDMNVQYFFWVTNDSIVYSNREFSEDTLRLYTINIYKENPQFLLPPAKHKVRWVTPVKSYDGNILMMMNQRDSTVFDLYRVRLDGSGVELVDQNPGNVTSWFTSQDGKVRLALSSDSVEDHLWFRADEGLPYRQILETDYTSKILPLGPVRNSLTEFYALSNINRDKLAVTKIDLVTGQELEVLYEHKAVDMNREGYSHDLQEVLYSSVNLNKKETTVYNPKLQRIYAKLKQEFKDYAIDILEVDQSIRTVIFRVYTDVNPGGFYYYDSKKDKIVELSLSNPALADRKMSPMKEVSFNARDGRVIHGYLTYPVQKKSAYPVVVLIHDGPNRRDMWGFNNEVQFLANRGYAVFQINYRGSFGFGKEFLTAGFRQWGGEIQNDINDGVAWLIHQGVADKDRVAIMGTGFGGYSALYAACFNPTLYKCAVSYSGFTNLFTYFKEIPPYYHQYVSMYHHIVGNPNKEYQLFRAISPVFHAEKVRMPIMMVYGGKDKYNSLTDVNQFIQKIKNNNVPVKYIFKENEGRRFKEDESVIEFYQELELFLHTHL